MKNLAAKLPLELKSKLISAYIAGEPMQSLVSTFGISRITIERYAKSKGVSRTKIIKPRRYLTNDEKQAAITAYMLGDPIDKIAQDFDISTAPVFDLIKCSGITKRRAKAQVEIPQKQQIIQLYTSGLSSTEIALIYGITRTSVVKYARQAGVSKGANFRASRNKPIIEAYKKGNNCSEVARNFNMSECTVYAIVNNAKEIRSQKRITNEQKHTILNAYLKGDSTEKLAKVFNVSRSSIANTVREKGQLRKRGGKTRLQKLIRTSQRYSDWRKSIFVRDNFTCQHCKSTDVKSRASIQADHIYPFSAILGDYSIATSEQAMSCEALWDLNNGRTLCEACHKKTDTYGIKALKYLSKRRLETP